MPVNDPFIVAIAKRIRSLVASEPAQSLKAISAIPDAQPAVRRLVDDPESTIDATMLIDLTAALVREFGVDPHWLLAGRYDTSIHRQALTLGEDRSEGGAHALQNFVRRQYQRLRERGDILELPQPKASSE